MTRVKPPSWRRKQPQNHGSDFHDASETILAVDSNGELPQPPLAEGSAKPDFCPNRQLDCFGHDDRPDIGIAALPPFKCKRRPNFSGRRSQNALFDAEQLFLVLPADRHLFPQIFHRDGFLQGSGENRMNDFRCEQRQPGL